MDIATLTTLTLHRVGELDADVDEGFFGAEVVGLELAAAARHMARTLPASVVEPMLRSYDFAVVACYAPHDEATVLRPPNDAQDRPADLLRIKRARCPWLTYPIEHVGADDGTSVARGHRPRSTTLPYPVVDGTYNGASAADQAPTKARPVALEAFAEPVEMGVVDADEQPFRGIAVWPKDDQATLSTSVRVLAILEAKGDTPLAERVPETLTSALAWLTASHLLQSDKEPAFRGLAMQAMQQYQLALQAGQPRTAQISAKPVLPLG